MLQFQSSDTQSASASVQTLITATGNATDMTADRNSVIKTTAFIVLLLSTTTATMVTISNKYS